MYDAGVQVWAFAHGIDERQVEPPKSRKSVGAECNWGIRFQNDADAVAFMDNLAGELSTRMKGECLRAPADRRHCSCHHIFFSTALLCLTALDRLQAWWYNHCVLSHQLSTICSSCNRSRLLPGTVALMSLGFAAHKCHMTIRGSCHFVMPDLADSTSVLIPYHKCHACMHTTGVAGSVCHWSAAAGVKGRTISLKLKRRKTNAPDPPKFMGHGDCDNMSRSVTLSRFTDASAELASQGKALLKALRLDPTQIRGIGLNVWQLNPLSCLQAALLPLSFAA